MKKQILFSIVCLSLLFVSVSCSDENEAADVQELSLKVEKDVSNILRSAEIISDNLKQAYDQFC